MKNYTRIYATINLDAVVSNVEAMKQYISPETKLMGIVKADGYGHGAVPVAFALEPYVSSYGVANIDEALILKRHGIQKPILILGVTHQSRYEELIHEEIRPAIFTMEQAASLSELAVTMGKRICVHLALDTGMNRIGMRADDTGVELAASIAALPGIEAEGLFTHFARADEADKTSTIRQMERYQSVVEQLSKKGISIPIHHCANSAGILDHPGTNRNLVRAGIAIYGLYPSDEVGQTEVALTPVMSISSFITYIKTIEAGCEVSYGGTFTAKKEMRIATIPVGYADGYPRNLSGNGYVLIHGKRADILGRICMDQLMVDVTEIPEANLDDAVILIGRDGEEEIRVEDLAARCGGFHYEIICDIGKRVPRVYTQNGIITGTIDNFQDVYPDFLPKSLPKR